MFIDHSNLNKALMWKSKLIDNDIVPVKENENTVGIEKNIFSCIYILAHPRIQFIQFRKQ